MTHERITDIASLENACAEHAANPAAPERDLASILNAAAELAASHAGDHALALLLRFWAECPAEILPAWAGRLQEMGEKATRNDFRARDICEAVAQAIAAWDDDMRGPVLTHPEETFVYEGSGHHYDREDFASGT